VSGWDDAIPMITWIEPRTWYLRKHADDATLRVLELISLISCLYLSHYNGRTRKLVQFPTWSIIKTTQTSYSIPLPITHIDSSKETIIKSTIILISKWNSHARPSTTPTGSSKAAPGRYQREIRSGCRTRG